MKTLDEVIDGLRDRMGFGDPVLVDAIHYLKEYRDKMANDEKAYKRGYSCGYAKAKEDEEVSRRWDESYRASQMPWNHGCEMGGCESEDAG